MQVIITLDNINAQRYYLVMIKSFRGKDAEKVFLREQARALSPQILKLAYRKLLILDAAERIEDLKIPPGNRLEKLSGDRKGQYSIRINNQWRVCFRWQGGDAFDVEITDYH